MNSIKRNFIYNLFYQILTFVLPLITTPYLSRVLGAEKTGIYSYSYSVAYYFVLFAMLGLNNYGNREIAKVRDDINTRSRVFWEIYGLQFITAIGVIFIYAMTNLLLRNELINWIMLIYVASALFDINWFFWGMEEFKITVTRNTVIKLATVVSILLFVKSVNDVFIYSFIMAGSMFISPIILWTYLKKRIIWIKPSIKNIFKHLKPNLILFIPVIAVSFYKVMDKIMLGSMASYVEVGFYDYAEKVIAIPTCCVNALGTVMLPRMSNLVAKKDNKAEQEIMHKSMIFGTALAAAMSFGLIGIANVFVPFFYGAGFEKCIYLFYIILPSCVFLAIANVIRTQYLIPHSMDKEFTVSLILGAVVNLVINAMLIPKIESVGAAIGTLIAEMVVCVYQVYCVKAYIPIKKYLSDIAWLVVGGLAMMAIVRMLPWIGSNMITIIIKVIVGVIVFSAITLIKYKALLLELVGRKRK